MQSKTTTKSENPYHLTIQSCDPSTELFRIGNPMEFSHTVYEFLSKKGQHRGGSVTKNGSYAGEFVLGNIFSAQVGEEVHTEAQEETRSDLKPEA